MSANGSWSVSSSGRQSVMGTTPGSTRSSPSKNRSTTPDMSDLDDDISPGVTVGAGFVGEDVGAVVSGAQQGGGEVDSAQHASEPGDGPPPLGPVGPDCPSRCASNRYTPLSR